MTATKVDGKAVIGERRVLSPLSTPDNDILFTRIVELLLDDNTWIHGCTECDFTGASLGFVRAHLRRDHPKRGAPAGEAWREVTLADAVDAVVSTDKIRTELYEWRTRAKRAEADLAAIKRVMGGVMGGAS